MELKPCPFCGSKPVRRVVMDALHVECPACVSVGFHNHIRLGNIADIEGNTRAGDTALIELLEEEVGKIRRSAFLDDVARQDSEAEEIKIFIADRLQKIIDEAKGGTDD